jgi:hypothetical protein
LTLSQRIRSIFLLSCLAAPPFSPGADAPHAVQPLQLKVVEINEPNGQILSYRQRAGSITVQMRGTKLAPEAQIDMKVGSRPGFLGLNIGKRPGLVEVEMNGSAVSGLRPAHTFGKDFLTYVVWAVSADGKASNLGEVAFSGNRANNMKLTTPLQTFWLMVTAEPNYAVIDPSRLVVMYSRGLPNSMPPESKALVIPGKLFYFTHYNVYDSVVGSSLEPVPNQLLQARKAVELASKSGILVNRPTGTLLKEEEYTRAGLAQAKSFLAKAEAAYQKNPKGQDVVQFARTAVQSAENARSLSTGAAGNLQLPPPEIKPVRVSRRASAPTPEVAVKTHPPEQQTTKTVAVAPAPPPGTFIRLVSQPAFWFALLGWGVAIVLLFRRKTR